MTAKSADQPRSPGQPPASNARPPDTGKAPRPPALNKPERPDGGQGRVDVTGIIPDNIHVDPDLTEGHPGYDESGDSEIIPSSRPSKGGASKDKGPAG